MDIPTPPSGHGFVALNSCGFAFWWLLILLVHLTTFAYNACFALFYWSVDALYLMFALASHARAHQDELKERQTVVDRSHLPDKLLRMAAPIVHGWWPSDTCGSICDPYIEHHSASEPAARRQIWMSVDNLEVPLR
ncbi:hypothetical protein PC120_g12708 [Phytophthora cactorum]|nr:hypothetical protein PC120_g12708 [Phytophthora cactorum]